MNKKKIAILFLTFFTLQVSGQKIQYFKSINFLEKSDSKTNYSRYYSWQNNKDIILVNDFLKKEKLFQGVFRGFEDESQLNTFISFHNGKSNRENITRKQEGEVTYFEESGIKRELFLKGTDRYFTQIYDLSSTPILINGNGEYRYENPIWKTTTIQVFEDSLLKSHFLLQSDIEDTVHLKVDEPIYIHNEKKLSKFLTNNISEKEIKFFSSYFRRFYVSFDVDDTGKFKNFLPLLLKRDKRGELQVVSMFDVGIVFSERTLKRIQKIPSGIFATPAKISGRNVTTKVLLPVNMN